MHLQAYLDHSESTLDPKTSLPGCAFHGPGYHSTVSNGTWVHQTRETMDYVIAMLQADHPKAGERVPKIISQVLALQETNPTKATFGLWPWLFEESLDQMSPPDWNWADFIGVRIAQMLKCHADQLGDEIKGQMRIALDRAAWSIFRRNTHAGYTNIAVMGAACTAVAGELLDEPGLLEYAQIRLQNVVDHVALNGSFAEYNSPTYTTVLLEECSRMYLFCEDPLIRALSHELLVKAWQVIGEHYHPATHQWSGPNARAYMPLLSPHILQIIADGLDIQLPVHPQYFGGGDLKASLVPTQPCPLVPTQPCPDEFKSLFGSEKTKTPICIMRQFAIHRDATQIGTTWMNDVATLGAINIEDTWNQRRPVLAYWKTVKDPAVSLRVRLLHDDYDFASGMIRTQQQDNRVLMAFNLLDNRGDTHISLDQPDKPIFTFRSLKLQWELLGQDVSAQRIDDHRFELLAGDYRAILHTAAGQFDGQPITWECGQIEGGVTLTAICYQGEPKTIDLREVCQMQLACALELIPITQVASSQTLTIQKVHNTGYTAQWDELEVQVPQVCQSYIC